MPGCLFLKVAVGLTLIIDRLEDVDGALKLVSSSLVPWGVRVGVRFKGCVYDVLRILRGALLLLL